MSPTTLPFGDIMRKPQSRFVTIMSVYLLLGAIAVAQTDEPTNEVVVLNQGKDGVGQNSSVDSTSFFRKMEDLFGQRLVDLSQELSKVEARIEAAAKKIQNAASAQEPEPAAEPHQIAPPAHPATPQPARTIVEAERVTNDSFGLIVGDGMDSQEAAAMPFLNESTPEWVKNGLKNGQLFDNERNFVISSTLLPDLEQCNEDLKSRMMVEVRAYLKKNVLEHENVKLPELTQEYIEKYWVVRGQVFDNVQDRPSGSYHQVWIGLHISSEQLAKIKDWEKRSERDIRTKKAGVAGGISVFAITLLSGAVGLLARREKAKLKK